MDEATEMRRMLEWFKAELPRHDVSEWVIRAQPTPPPVLVEGDPPLLVSPSGEFRIEGYGKCQRCGTHFPIPTWGNASAIDEAAIPRVVDKMKEWVQRDADKPCWGDVPELRDNTPTAVLDSMTS